MSLENSAAKKLRLDSYVPPAVTKPSHVELLRQLRPLNRTDTAMLAMLEKYDVKHSPPAANEETKRRIVMKISKGSTEVNEIQEEGGVLKTILLSPPRPVSEIMPPPKSPALPDLHRPWEKLSTIPPPRKQIKINISLPPLDTIIGKAGPILFQEAQELVSRAFLRQRYMPSTTLEQFLLQELQHNSYLLRNCDFFFTHRIPDTTNLQSLYMLHTLVTHNKNVAHMIRGLIYVIRPTYRPLMEDRLKTLEKMCEKLILAINNQARVLAEPKE